MPLGLISVLLYPVSPLGCRGRSLVLGLRRLLGMGSSSSCSGSAREVLEAFLSRVESLVFDGRRYSTLVERDEDDCSARLYNPYLPAVEMKVEARDGRVEVCSYTGVSMVPHLCDAATDYLVLRFTVEALSGMDYVRPKILYADNHLYICVGLAVPEQLDSVEEALPELQFSLELLAKMLEAYNVEGCGHLERLKRTISVNQYRLIEKWRQHGRSIDELKEQLASVFGEEAAEFVDKVISEGGGSGGDAEKMLLRI